VTAIEFEPELAERAKANLAHLPNVTVVQGNGAEIPCDPADVIYVNAGTTHPVAAWLDALKEGGRLVLPLTTNSTISGLLRRPQGAMFRIERKGADYFVKLVSGAAFIPGEGMRDPASEAALAAAFDRASPEAVTRLYRTDDVPAARCWARGLGWTLAYS
jgi:protein-L-isoaspartate(D-aspartate) O-methyltransferase